MKRLRKWNRRRKAKKVFDKLFEWEAQRKRIEQTMPDAWRGR